MELIGITLNLIGTIILAFSTGSFFKWIGLSVNAHEIFIQTFASGGNIVNIVNTTKHLTNSFNALKKWMILGLFLIVGGFAMQLAVLVISNL
jgi:hypothetical protein